MEKQSTSKFLRSVIAVVALFMLAVSGFLLTSCKHVHSEPNDFGACTDCGSIIDWDKFGSQMSTLLDPSFDELTASLTDLASEVTEVKGDVDSIIDALNVADDGSDIDTIVKNVQAVLDQIENLIGANSSSVAAKATPATITGIANAVTSIQETLNKIGAGNIEHVCENHQFDTEEILVIIPATCEENGLGYYRCKNCNAVATVEIKATGHTEVVTETPVKAGDCTSQITVTTTCSVCGETLKTETKDGYAEHEWVIDEETSTATCTEAGEVTYTCAHEGCTVTKTEAVDALGHSEDEGIVTTQPTCTTEGVKTFTCTRCGEVVRTEAVPVVEHTYSEETRVWKYTGDIEFNIVINNTTVDKITQTQYDVCSVCDHEEVVMKEDGKTPVTKDTYHSLYIDTELTNAETNGDVRVKAELTQEELTKYGLNEGGINADKGVNGYVNVSCTSEAKLYYICADTDCPVKHNAPITVDLPALDHVWVDDTAKEDVPATCTSTGIHYEVCSACGTTHEVVTDMLDHTRGDAVVVAPTCEENGTRTYTCTVCQQPIVETYDPKYPDKNLDLKALGHDKVVNVEYEEITEHSHKAITTTTCAREDCDYKEVVEETVDHKALVFESEEEAEAANVKYKYSFNIYQAEDGKFYFTDASCDDPGVRIYLCECGYWYEDTYFATKYVPELGHEYGEAVVVKGDCVTGGYSIFVCERCGDSYTVTYDQAKGHEWIVVAAQEATCDTNGWKGFAYCKKCGKVVLFEASDAVTTPDTMSTDYVEGITCDGTEEEIEAVKDLEGIKIDATGHTWSEKPMVFCEDGCLSPVWEVTYCVTCFNYDEEGDFTIKANGAEYPESAEGYVDTDFGAATDEFIIELLNILKWAGSDDVPPVSFTKEQLLSDEFNGHYNITGIKFVAAKGHILTDKTSSYDAAEDKWGYSENATIVCKNDANLDSYADAWKFAQFVKSDVDETAFKAAFDEIFGTNDSNRDTYEINTDGTKPALAGVCKDCGMPIATADHDEHYYMFMITNEAGEAYDYKEDINRNDAYVHTDTYLVEDKDGNTAYKTQVEIDASEGAWTKVVFTYEQVIGMKYTNPNGSVNCYFEGFCARNCGIDMGHKAQHTFPTSDNYDKYHNCKHGDICVWCSNVVALSDDHNLQDLEEIAASENEEYVAAAEALYNSGYAWVGKDTEGATCKDPAEDWTITVCVSCLLDWYKDGASDPDVWTLFDANDPESEGNYTSKVVETKGKHNYVEKSVGDRQNPNCLVGFAAWYECTVCGEKLTYEEQTAANAPDYIKELKPLNEDDYIADGYSEAKPHNVAPVFNYFANSSYKPATDTTSAYMNFICVECGEHLQGYYDDGVAEDGSIRYTMASEQQIKDYLADPDKVAEWGNIQVVRAEDKAAVTTLKFDANATDAEKVAAVADAIADAEKEGATSVYLTIPGNITFGASDTTTFTEGEATVWQAYGITFSEKSSVKKIVLDLGGNTLTFAGTTVDKESSATVGATYKITGEGSVIFSNGTIEFTAFTAAQNPTFGFNANTTELVFDHITATVKGSAAFAGFGSNGEEAVGTMTIKNSKITTEGYYVVSTNASKSASSKVVINIIDSTLTSVQPDNDSVGIMFNVPGELNVSGSFVTADSQGMIIRGGNVKATIKDTEVTITGDCSEANVEGYDKYESDDWATGNNVPMGAFVIGNRNTDGYQAGLATVVLEKVTINAPEDVNKVYVYAQEGDTTVDLTITNCGLEAADIVNGSNANNAEVYKLTIDGAQVLPAPVVDEGNTEEAQG